MDVLQGNVLLAPMRDSSRRLGSQPEQGFDRGGRLRARPQPQHLPQQGEEDDDRGCLEVHGNPAHRHERRGEHLRRQRGNHAVDA